MSCLRTQRSDARQYISQVIIFEKNLSLNIDFVLVYRTDPDEMPPLYAAYSVDPAEMSHFIWVFTVC